MDNIDVVVDEVWNKLVKASRVEPPLNVKPDYDDVAKKEEPVGSKQFVDFKTPSEMLVEEYQSLPAKSNWSSNIKFSLFSNDKGDMDAPVCSCHLLLHLAYKQKIFGDDAYGKVSARCKIGAAAVNLLMKKKHSSVSFRFFLISLTY
jgi:hypothetical protein